MAESVLRIAPQPGMQEQVCASRADITVAGSGAGTGKTFLANLLAAIPGYMMPDYACYAFRRLTTELRGSGGILDESYKIFPLLGGKRVGPMGWKFPSGAAIEYHHLQYEDTLRSFQSKQFARLILDEASQFTERQVFFLLSRMRSLAPIARRAYFFTNPDPDCIIARLIAWWIAPDGFPIHDRCGKLRWFVRDEVSDELLWFATRAEALQRTGKTPTSLTFIPGKLTDNKALLAADPDYAARLDSLNAVDRARMRDGNWLVRASAGTLWQAKWVGVVPEAPASLRQYRCWDLAATEGGQGARTAGVRGGRRDGLLYVTDAVTIRGSPNQVETMLRHTAEADGHDVAIRIWLDPGQSSKFQQDHITRHVLEGFDVRFERAAKNKVEYFSPVSSCAESGNMRLVRGLWIGEYSRELEGFPDARVCDLVDATSLLWIASLENDFVALW